MLREGRISWIRRVREDLSILEFVFCCPQEREFGLFAQHTTMTPIHQTYALFGYKCLSCWIILVLIGIHVIDSRCRTGQGEGKKKGRKKIWYSTTTSTELSGEMMDTASSVVLSVELVCAGQDLFTLSFTISQAVMYPRSLACVHRRVPLKYILPAG